MDMHRLSADLNVDVIRQLADLVGLKATGGEGDSVASASVLDAFITTQLMNIAPRPEKIDTFAGDLVTQADATFLRGLWERNQSNSAPLGNSINTN